MVDNFGLSHVTCFGQMDASGCAAAKAWRCLWVGLPFGLLPSHEKSFPLGSCCLFSLRPWMNTGGAHLDSTCSLEFSPVQSLPTDLQSVTGTREEINDWCFNPLSFGVVCYAALLWRSLTDTGTDTVSNICLKRHKRNSPKCRCWLVSEHLDHVESSPLVFISVRMIPDFSRQHEETK